MSEQKTIEWHLQRLGKPTASRFGDIKPGRGQKWSATTMTYMRELLAERLTGNWSEPFGSAIEWGLDNEAEARQAFIDATGININECSFYEVDGLGGSPDGISDSGQVIIEVKCPFNSGNHINNILNGAEDHMPQMQANMYFTGASVCYFVSYDPRMPEGMRLFTYLVQRDQGYIDDMLTRVREFNSDLNQLETKVRRAMS